MVLNYSRTKAKELHVYMNLNNPYIDISMLIFFK